MVINMYNIGIDLGGTNIAAGIVNENYEIIKKASTPTNVSTDRCADDITADIAALCKKIVAEAGLTMDDIGSIGIATPGTANCETGEIIYANNLPFSHYDMQGKLSAALGTTKRVYIENDANAAAKAESVAGVAKGSKYSVMITLGTGVGGGIVIDNKLYTGFNYAGAELGHIVIEVDGAPCTCGRNGCWEAYSSATALIRMTKEKIDECRATGRKSIMLDAPRVSGRLACDSMRAGDEAAKEVYDKYIKYLAAGLANIVNIFQPEVISLGGGVSGEGQSLIDSLLPLVRAQSYGVGFVKDLPELRIAKLGNDAGIIGAALLG